MKIHIPLLFILLNTLILLACQGEPGVTNTNPQFALDLWTTPEAVSPSTQSFSEYPNVAVNQNGDAIVVWREQTGVANSTPTVFINAYTDQTGWGLPTIIDPDIAANMSGPPDIAMNDNGDAIVGWGMRTTVSSKYRMWVKRYTAANSWEPTKQIDLNVKPNTSYTFTGSDVAIDEFGNAVAVWAYDNSISKDIWANVYTVGKGWGSAQNIRTIGINIYDDGTPKVSMRAGNAIAVYSSDLGIIAHTYQTRVGWDQGSNFLINSDGESLRPQIAMSADGIGIAIWEQEEYANSLLLPDPPTDIYATHYNGVSWSEIVMINPKSELESFDQPRIAMDASGNAIAAWTSHYRASDHISASYYNKISQQWSVAESISTEGGFSPDIAMNSAGNAVVSWVRTIYTRNGYFTDVNVTRFSRETGWGPSGRIGNTANNNDITDAKTAINKQGTFFTVWEKFNKSVKDYNSYDVWASHVK